VADQSIALLGAPTSGKTTFLAALSIALARRKNEWKLVGGNDASTQTLITLTEQLADRAFPEPTVGIDEFSWLLIGPVMRKIQLWWIFAKRTKRIVQIRLNVADPSGEVAKGGRTKHANRDDLIKNLMASRGVVFLFDPISEFEKGNAFSHTFGIISELAQRMIGSPDYVDGYLPHHVAICISKFDEVKILNSAQQLDLLTYDPDDSYGFPRVDDDDAREFFEHLCRVSQSGSADLALNTIEQHFRPDRIKYFVTSAIGFYLDPATDGFNPADYQNILTGLEDPPTNPGGQGTAQRMRIRGAIHPINVIEPLLWVCQELSASPGD
jgi:hypothetical protein